MVPDPEVGKESRKTVDILTLNVSTPITLVLLSLLKLVPKLMEGFVQENMPSNKRTGNRYNDKRRLRLHFLVML